MLAAWQYLVGFYLETNPAAQSKVPSVSSSSLTSDPRLHDLLKVAFNHSCDVWHLSQWDMLHVMCVERNEVSSQMTDGLKS